MSYTFVLLRIPFGLTKAMQKKLVINLAPTGMIPDKAMTGYVPITPAEIAADVLACAKLGASMIHLHARAEDGTPTYHKKKFGEIISRIRHERSDLIIIVSTSGRSVSEFEKRSEVLELEGDLKPDMASLTLGSFNFPRSTSHNSPEIIVRLAEKMKERGIKPELEIFDLGMANYARYLIEKQILEPPYYFNILLGNVCSAQATMQHVGLIVSELPPQSTFALAGIGSSQLSMNALGIAFADGVRVGLEDNIWYDDERTVKASNVSLCQRINKMATAIERPIASANEVRTMLALSPFVPTIVQTGVFSCPSLS